jgi:[ribosomal protein S18]-alanine N-acetyltransferase
LAATILFGYCGYWLILDEAHITTIAVHPSYRGNSLGEIQLLQMLERCMGQTVHWITLEVRVSNYSAQNLYYKYGFRSAGLRHKYYQDNHEDALIMTTPDIATQAFRTLYNKNKQELLDKLGTFPEGFES